MRTLPGGLFDEYKAVVKAQIQESIRFLNSMPVDPAWVTAQRAYLRHVADQAELQEQGYLP